ncbi:MAG: hypothetical protein OXB86_06610 [Bdellovibrionales bacterium]|nr:hypothetical protein [Bdellovibrionales bacterium]
MRFATEQPAVATVSKPNSFLNPIFLQEGLIYINRKSQNSNRIDVIKGRHRVEEYARVETHLPSHRK